MSIASVIEDRWKRRDLERVHGVGRNCPQQAGPYADATEDGEGGAHGDQDRDGNGTTARQAGVVVGQETV